MSWCIKTGSYLDFGRVVENRSKGDKSGSWKNGLLTAGVIHIRIRCDSV